jgi:multidrug efflux pump subunit AcrB
MIRTLLHNHVLANLAFVLALVIGFLSYGMLPRQQDPTINFNWVVITTILPGASALDVEKKVTDPLEDAIRNIQDIKFVSSNSRQSVSSLLVRFGDVDQRTFDKHMADIRREIQNTEDELPEQAEDPLILEITSANAFPSASIAVVGRADDENLRVQARNVEKALERLGGVDRVDPVGLSDPELHVYFDPAALEALGLSPNQVADTVSAFFQDVAAGSLELGRQNWLVRLVGSSSEPSELGRRPVVGAPGEVTLERVAGVQRGRERPDKLAMVEGRPAVLMAVMKQENANTLEVVERIQDYIDQRNTLSRTTGVELVLVDDQTIPTRTAIGLMQNNALIGLGLVLLVAWLFLGSRIALLTAIGIPFILAGTFWVLHMMGETLNIMALLGVVIVLGMLVDDAVVVVEAIYYRLQRGMGAVQASIESLREVASPVTAAVLTTIAAFLPLMLLPGILGDYMRVIPMVVSIALAISLIEAFWMLPTHVVGARVNYRNPSWVQIRRARFTHWVQIQYVRLLLRVLRRPMVSLLLVSALVAAAMLHAAAAFVPELEPYVIKKIDADFFAADTLRLFYVNVEMPPATPIEDTLAKVLEIEAKVRRHVRDGEVRAMVSYAGNMFTETSPMLGDHYGQLLVGLHPNKPGLRSVEDMIESMRAEVTATPGPVQISFLRLAGGPPTSKPIQVKVRGDHYQELREAADTLRELLAGMPGVIDISDDASRGRPELLLRLDEDAINRAGLNPLEVNRAVQLMVDGQIVADMRDQGEKLEVRVRRVPLPYGDLAQLLALRLPAPGGGSVALQSLVREERPVGLGNIRHYNFRRAITVEADIAEGGMDTVTANRLILEAWEQHRARFADIDLDLSGELDDIQESIDSIGLLFIFGLGLMYLILGTQFRSYWQPFMILVTVPMALTGVVAGLMVTGYPLSLFNLYGMVALAGIAVNAAIVLISAANQRLEAGMTVLHATLYAARRRVIPILITTLTTVAGLSSLATGLGGKSLIWGPVAASIVWGLAFSTVLTLIVIPLLYRLFMGRAHRRRAA